MLLQIRDYIQREKIVSTQQLAREFHMDEETLHPMLSVWIHKGVIKRHQPARCKKHCFDCRPKAPTVYEYIQIKID